jgi:hypothetical protein
MASVRCTDVQARPTEFLDVTSLTLDEFQQLVRPFEAAFQAHMDVWRLDGQPRTARQFTVDKHCPLPTPADRLFFILVSLKTSALQVVQGRLFGMGQSKANQWMHVLLPAFLAALRALGDAPARSLTALAQRLGVSEADAATVGAPLEEEPVPFVTAPVSPLVPLTAPSGGSSAPKTLLHRRHVIAARKKTIQCTMSSWAIPSSRASCAVGATAVAAMTSGWPRPPCSPARLAAGCDRIWASWPARARRSRASCRPSSHAVSISRWRSTGRTRRCPSVGCGSSMSTAGSSVVALSKTASASGKKASALW